MSLLIHSSPLIAQSALTKRSSSCHAFVPSLLFITPLKVVAMSLGSLCGEREQKDGSGPSDSRRFDYALSKILTRHDSD